VTLVAAHGGASSVAPQNTIEAFEQAIELGADMVEFDVRMTRDDVLVVVHDSVRESAYDELPAAVPRLEEVLDTCAGRVALDVELKEGGYEEEVLRVVRGDFVVTSFLDEVVATVKRLRPAVRAGLLLGEETPLDARAIQARQRACSADFLAPNVSLLDAGLDAGDGAVVWTVNDVPRLRRYLAEQSVDVVVTDDPLLALSLTGRR
jgi:glycerophosphoryl diester phosphodiesterase